MTAKNRQRQVQQQKQIPCGNDSKKSKNNSNGEEQATTSANADSLRE
jgi:hypothetical protein